MPSEAAIVVPVAGEPRIRSRRGRARHCRAAPRARERRCDRHARRRAFVFVVRRGRRCAARGADVPLGIPRDGGARDRRALRPSRFLAPPPHAGRGPARRPSATLERAAADPLHEPRHPDGAEPEGPARLVGRDASRSRIRSSSARTRTSTARSSRRSNASSPRASSARSNISSSCRRVPNTSSSSRPRSRAPAPNPSSGRRTGRSASPSSKRSATRSRSSIPSPTRSTREFRSAASSPRLFRCAMRRSRRSARCSPARTA